MKCGLFSNGMERSVLKDSREVVDKDVVDGVKECRRGGDGPEIRQVACGQGMTSATGWRESEGQDRHTRSRRGRGEVKMVMG
jgi:hypothetical protein